MQVYGMYTATDPMCDRSRKRVPIGTLWIRPDLNKTTGSPLRTLYRNALRMEILLGTKRNIGEIVDIPARPMSWGSGLRV